MRNVEVQNQHTLPASMSAVMMLAARPGPLETVKLAAIQSQHPLLSASKPQSAHGKRNSCELYCQALFALNLLYFNQLE